MAQIIVQTDVVKESGRSTKSVLLKCAALVLVATISWLGMSNAKGNPYLFLLFDISFLALAALALPRPRLYSYTFIAALLFLGFWMKMMMHVLFDTAFLEPIGTFDGSPQAWDRALSYAAMAAIGACIARCLHLLLARSGIRAEKNAVASNISSAPQWFRPLRTLLWTGSFLLLLLLNAINFQVAFYQTGVNPKLILPIHLNVIAAWLVNVGFALWFACLIHWELSYAPKNFANTLIVPIVEALACSVSALSRSFYVMHTIPYYLALGTHWTLVRGMLSWRTRISLVVLWAVVLVASLLAVSWMRIDIYYLGFRPTYFTIPEASHHQKEISKGATFENQIKPMAQQVANILVSRWIGLEGTLAVSAYEAKSPALLLIALRENPVNGNDSIYQKIADSPYAPSKTFTFLTLPGFVAVLAYSGSLLMVLIGTLLVVLLAIGIETAGMRLTGNHFLMSVAGLTMANVLCQTNFPYLTAIFLAQLWVAMIFIWALQSVRWPTPRAQTAKQG